MYLASVYAQKSNSVVVKKRGTIEVFTWPLSEESNRRNVLPIGSVVHVNNFYLPAQLHGWTVKKVWEGDLDFKSPCFQGDTEILLP